MLRSVTCRVSTADSTLMVGRGLRRQYPYGGAGFKPTVPLWWAGFKPTVPLWWAGFKPDGFDFLRCLETPRGYCVCLLLSPWCTEVPILSTNQRTACVAREIAGTLSGSQYPNGGVLRESTAQCGSVRVTPTFWQWKRNLYRTFAD